MTQAERLEALAFAIWDGDTVSADPGCPNAAEAWEVMDERDRDGMLAGARAALRFLGLDPDNPPAAGAARVAQAVAALRRGLDECESGPACGTACFRSALAFLAEIPFEEAPPAAGAVAKAEGDER